MNKRLLIVILITLLLVVLGGFVLYFTLFSNTNPDEETDDTTRGSLFPFLGDDQGVREGSDTEAQPSSQDSPTFNQNETPTLLRKIWHDPVAGATFATDNNGSTTIRLVERGTGNIYEVGVDTNQTRRLTNTTIPKIQEASWVSSDRLILRYLRDNEDLIETFSATVVLPDENATTTNDADDTIGDLRGVFLPTNILDLTVRGDGTLFYIRESNNGVRGTLSNIDGTEAREIFSSPIRDLLSEWMTNTTIGLTTKASGSVAGTFLTLNTTTGKTSSLIDNVIGLTTYAGPSKILYATYNSRIPSVSSYDLTNEQVTQLPISTLTEKCVFTQGGNSVICAAPRNFSRELLPDSWYQGVVHFNDDVYEIHPSTGLSQKILDTGVYTNEQLDIIDLSIDAGEKYLLFRNKSDYTLWLFHLPITSVQIESDA